MLAAADGLGRHGVWSEKVVSQGIRHMRGRGIRPQGDEAKVRAMVGELQAAQQGRAGEPKPWEKGTAERWTAVLVGSLQAAKGLAKNPEWWAEHPPGSSLWSLFREGALTEVRADEGED